MSYQLNAVTKFKIARDTIANKIFGSGLEFKASLENPTVANEQRKKKLTSKIAVTPYNETGAGVTFNELDWAVFDAVHSELAAGNKFTTIARIGRILGNGDSKHKISGAVFAAIFGSVNKLGNAEITLDTSAATKIYPDLEASYSGRILNVSIVPVTVNGYLVSGALKIEPSPVYLAADAKDHVSTVDADFFGSGRASVQTMLVRHYLLRRVMAIKGGRVTAVITFADLIWQCGLGELKRYQLQDIRDQVISPTLERCKAKKLIDDWNFEKAAQGKITGVRIAFARKPLPHKGYGTPT